MAVIVVSALFSIKKDGGVKEMYTLNLPETISVYYKEEGVSKETDLEDYVICVVSAEVPASFHKEAIKAQAVAARTYIYNKYKKFTEIRPLHRMSTKMPWCVRIICTVAHITVRKS